MNRSNISLLVLAAAFLVVMAAAPHVVLTVFAAILFGLLLHGAGGWTQRRLHLPRRGLGIAFVCLLVIVALAVLGTSTASAVAKQFNELLSEIPRAINSIQERLNDYAWAQELLRRANPKGLLPGEGTSAASTAVTSTFGALGSLVIIVVAGIYAALDPDRYRRGFLKLFAPAIRERADDVLARCVSTLKNWLAAQFIAMAVVGMLTGIGLWLIGIPLALILGVIAGLLAFIPNIGPILALIPGLLVASSQGMTTVLWVLAVYLGVQALESYLITPMVQQEKVHLPAVLVISGQLLFGVLFGVLGLALAMPLMALAMTLTNEVYVKDYLERGGSRGT